MSKKGIEPADALRTLYEEFPKKFKAGEVLEGELVIIKLEEPGDPDVYCVVLVQKQLAKTTRVYSVGIDEMTSYSSSEDRIDLPHNAQVVWLAQTAMAVGRLPS